ncbi:hypothetical protein C1701_17685 [Actinoalloteichus sp. AHMU CJ021]|uniref:hypothetical protein n=1 Tax=Actinoalloteichus sp. AHMU CJ021 TaxID=2072503 RepID=UPI000CA08CFF|nr:hypothetical protein C1701_17685 [Actinoalloteichus sp. AHMU CJ021]
MIDEDSLREAMRETTDGLRPPTRLAEEVIGGARARRRRRRRTGVTAVALAAALVVTGGALTTMNLTTTEVLGGEGAPAVARSWFDVPTRGDLADDRDFVGRASTTWRDELPLFLGIRAGLDEGGRGDPHLVAATTTPSGPAAIFVQRHAPPGDDESYDMLGLVAQSPEDGELHLLSVGRDEGKGQLYLFGEDDRTLIGLPGPEPLHLSTGPDIDGSTGEVTRQWEELVAEDGLILRQLPADSHAHDVVAATEVPDTLIPEELERRPPLAVLTSESRAAALDPGAAQHFLRPRSLDSNWNESLTFFYLPVASRPALTYQERLAEEEALDSPDNWRCETGENGGESCERITAAPSHPDSERELDLMDRTQRALRDSGRADLINHHSGGVFGSFLVIVRMTDGRIATIGEQWNRVQHGEAHAVVFTDDNLTEVDDFAYGGPTRPDDPVQLSVRLPDDEGWVVLSYQAELRYRTTPDGPWQAVESDRGAALLPAEAVQVEVSREGGTDVVELVR